MKPTLKNLASPVVFACGLLVGTVHGTAVTVKVDSTRQWLGWVNVLETNGTSYVSGNSWSVADLPAVFIPTNSPTGWPRNTQVVLGPNTSTYNLADPFWNFPDGSPNKILQAIFYVDVFTSFAGQTVTFQGYVTSNNIPGLTGAPVTGWQVIASVKEFTSSYDYLGEAWVPLHANSPFSVSRAIAPGRVCQYGFSVIGPNAAPGSANALTGAGILVEDPDPLITADPVGATIAQGATINLAVTAVGGSALSYQWKRDGVGLTNGSNISGANTANLAITNADLSDSGQYTVRVTDTAGSVTSQAAQLTVLCVLASEAEPFVIRTLVAHTNGSFTLVWGSCNSHLYEVQTSEVPSGLTGWTPRALMIGANGSTSWTSSNPPATDHRFYRVQRFSFDGDQDGDGLSNLAEFNSGTDLHNPDTDGDKLPDGWEVKYGLNPLNPNDAFSDSDGDGYSNIQEYQLPTRPNAPYSHPADPPRGLLGWWKLDEGTGTNVFDSSLNGHHGYVLGGNPAAVWSAGYYSNGVTLGGPANNWIAVPFQASLALPQELTLMGWVKPSAQGVLAGNFDAYGRGNYLLQFGPDHVELQFSPAGDGTATALQFDPNWSTNDWHHLTVCYSEGTNVAVFVDGEWRTNHTVTGSFVPVANPILIGFPGLTNTCSVDDVRLYNRALATNEIASLSRGNGLPLSMSVGQASALRAFGASESDSCQWSLISGQGFFTNTANCITEFRPSWSGAVTVQVVIARSGVFQTNFAYTIVKFPELSPLSDWNDGSVVQFNNNCYNFATDIRTDTIAQPGGPPFYYLYTCAQQINAAVSDGLQASVDLADLCHTSGLPEGHIVALLIWPNVDFHYVRMESNGLWSSKAGNYPATTLDNSGQPISDPRTANFGPYQFCQFFWVGQNVHILHFPH